jgi:hypothetical protein
VLTISFVMPGLVPGIHVFGATGKTWMAGSSPGMTSVSVAARVPYAAACSRGWVIAMCQIWASGVVPLATTSASSSTKRWPFFS